MSEMVKLNAFTYPKNKRLKFLSISEIIKIYLLHCNFLEDNQNQVENTMHREGRRDWSAVPTNRLTLNAFYEIMCSPVGTGVERYGILTNCPLPIKIIYQGSPTPFYIVRSYCDQPFGFTLFEIVNRGSIPHSGRAPNRRHPAETAGVQVCTNVWQPAFSAVSKRLEPCKNSGSPRAWDPAFSAVSQELETPHRHRESTGFATRRNSGGPNIHQTGWDGPPGTVVNCFGMMYNGRLVQNNS